MQRNNTNPWLLACAHLYALLCISNPAQAASQHSTLYTIQQAWFDNTQLYVLFEKNQREVEYSLLDRAGSIRREDKSLWLKKLPLQAGTVSLDGAQAADDLLYQDSDFVVTRERINTVALKTPCAYPNIVRGPKQLWYCNTLFNRNGQTQQLRPPTCTEQIGPWSQTATLSTIFVNAQTQFACSTAAQTSVSIAGPDGQWHTQALPQPYSLQNSHNNYSPYWFVLRATQGKQLLLCRKTLCKTTPFAQEYSYLVVTAKQIFFIRQQQLTKPELNITTANINDSVGGL